MRWTSGAVVAVGLGVAVARGVVGGVAVAPGRCRSPTRIAARPQRSNRRIAPWYCPGGPAPPRPRQMTESTLRSQGGCRDAIHRRARRAARDGQGLRRARAATPRRRVGGGGVLPRQRLSPHGRARAARAALPRGVRRPGRRLLERDRPRRGDGPVRFGWRRHGGVRPGRDGHPTDLQVRHRGAEAALPGPRDPWREGRRARHHRARHGQRRRVGAHARGAPQRWLAHQRRQALHHQRGALRLHPAGGPDRHARGGSARHHPLPGRQADARASR